MKHRNIDDLTRKHKIGADGYEFTRGDFLKVHESRSLVRVYEIPPGKSAYPYHYHLKNEETFFILKGEGLLRTNQGERMVKPGDLLFFPTGEDGAHKLTNTSKSEMLVYLDFDVVQDLDIAMYPDSGKIGIWGMDINRIYPKDSDVDYYEGEL